MIARARADWTGLCRKVQMLSGRSLGSQSGASGQVDGCRSGWQQDVFLLRWVKYHLDLCPRIH